MSARFSLQAARTGWRPLAWRIALASGAMHLLLLGPSLYMLQVYDRVLHFRHEWTLLLSSAALLAALAAAAWLDGRRQAGLLALQGLASAEWGARVRAEGLRLGLARQTEQAHAVAADLATLRQFVASPALTSALDAPWVPLYLLVLAALHPLLGVAALLWGAGLLALALRARRALAAPAEQTASALRREQAWLRSAEGQPDPPEALGMAGALLARWRALRGAQRDAAAAQHAQSLRWSLRSQAMRHLQQSLSLGVGAWLVVRGEMSVGAMIAANLLMNRALSPLEQWVGATAQLLAAHGAWTRLRALPPEPPAAGPLPPPVPGAPRLALQGLRVEVGDRVLLHETDLVLEAGRIAVVLGPSGAGKSVLAQACLGLWPGAAGQVLLDGRPLAALDRVAVGPLLGYLPQDVQLMDGSVAENIARFGPAEPARVLAAAQACGLHEPLLRLPQGYDTPVGPGGRQLSGGLRQRVGLARAAHDDPALLVLDEPNAHLDDAGERALAAMLRAQADRGAAVLVTSHRPAVLALADEVWVVQGGRVVRRDPPSANASPIPAATPRPELPVQSP